MGGSASFQLWRQTAFTREVLVMTREVFASLVTMLLFFLEK